MNNLTFCLFCQKDGSIIIREKASYNFYILLEICATLLCCLNNQTIFALTILIPNSFLLIMSRVKTYQEINKRLKKGYSMKVEGNRYSLRHPLTYILYAEKQQNVNK